MTRAIDLFAASYELPAQHKAAVLMLGNAVPPPMARGVIRALLRTGLKAC